MTEYICPICGKWKFFGQHTCPPVWYVRFSEHDGSDEQTIYADDPKAAAADFVAVNSDCESSDEQTVTVRRPGEEKHQTFTVYRELVPSYSAQEQRK
jgi:hypothetical protein